jgi:hypothetical protein
VTSTSKARALGERAPLADGFLSVQIMSRSGVTCALLALCFGLMPGLWLASQREVALAASAQPSKDPAPTTALLSGSEISVVESGGIAGRVHAVRLVAADGRVDVEYRAREAPVSAPPFAGTLERDRYVALWRQLEAARVWDIQSPAPTRGADLVHFEVRIRLGESARVVRWNEVGEHTLEIRNLAEIAHRLLAVGRETAFAR